MAMDAPLEERDADGVDLTLVRWMMSVTPDERLSVLDSTSAPSRSYCTRMIVADVPGILQAISAGEVDFILVGEPQPSCKVLLY